MRQGMRGRVLLHCGLTALQPLCFPCPGPPPPTNPDLPIHRKPRTSARSACRKRAGRTRGATRRRCGASWARPPRRRAMPSPRRRLPSARPRQRPRHGQARPRPDESMVAYRKRPGLCDRGAWEELNSLLSLIFKHTRGETRTYPASCAGPWTMLDGQDGARCAMRDAGALVCWKKSGPPRAVWGRKGTIIIIAL